MVYQERMTELLIALLIVSLLVSVAIAAFSWGRLYERSNTIMPTPTKVLDQKKYADIPINGWDLVGSPKPLQNAEAKAFYQNMGTSQPKPFSPEGKIVKFDKPSVIRQRRANESLNEYLNDVQRNKEPKSGALEI